MKILFFITMHRQLDELKIYSYFFNKFNHIKNFDIFIYNTNKNISEQMVRNNVNVNTNVYVHCDANNEGYVLGLFSGLSQNYDFYREYDFIVHLHPDVFILDDKKLYELLIDQKDENYMVGSSCNDRVLVNVISGVKVTVGILSEIIVLRNFL